MMNIKGCFFLREANQAQSCQRRWLFFFFLSCIRSSPSQNRKERAEHDWCPSWGRINKLTAIQKCWMHTDTLSSFILNAPASSLVLIAVWYWWRVTGTKYSWDWKLQSVEGGGVSVTLLQKRVVCFPTWSYWWHAAKQTWEVNQIKIQPDWYN